MVWFGQNDFSEVLTITWGDRYAGFICSDGPPTPGTRIPDTVTQAMSFWETSSDQDDRGDPGFSAAFARPMTLGQTMTASDDADPSVADAGVAGAIAVANSGMHDWTCGLGQEVDGNLATVCIFDLGGEGEQVVMMPCEKILLVFESTAGIDTGLAVAKALNGSLTVELDRQNPSRTVVFRKDKGWSTNQAIWATVNPIDLDLAETLFAIPG